MRAPSRISYINGMENPHQAGFVALVGLPNAGKSTLQNALVKFPVSIVSPKPQTTRHRILGILNGTDYQLCLMDTPGWLDKAADKLQLALLRAARAAAAQDADLLLLVVEARLPEPEEAARLAALAARGTPVILAVNKCDLVKDPAALERIAAAYSAAVSPVATHRVSALKGAGLPALLESLLKRLPESPPFYDKEQLSDRWERFFAAELIRSEIFALYHEEIPHACAVVIETFKEKAGRPDHIDATVFVEKPTQKAILLGKGGKAIRALRERSTAAIRNFTGRGTELELWIKVRKNWRQDPEAVREFGYAP